MIQFAGVDVVLPDGVFGPATVIVDGEQVAEIVPGTARGGSRGVRLELPGHFLLPGFIDVHVHGVEGADTLDGGGAVARIARTLPRYGVTAFCPTSVACPPATLRELLSEVRAERDRPDPQAARVLPAHLESNFINPDFKGAQPLSCLRNPAGDASNGSFTGAEVLAEIAMARPEVGIVTVAPELEGALSLIGEFVACGHQVSLGHSGATYDEAIAGIEAGATQATHLFNRMTGLSHRAPGLAGAVLEHPDVVAELVCDGVHVHPAVVRVALSAKGPRGVMAITDGTAGSGLAPGTRARLGGRPITVGDVAYLDDGTVAGSVLTMDAAFRMLRQRAGVDLVAAATMCSTTPARALRLEGLGAIAPGATADLVVLDASLNVVHTCIGGRLVWSRPG